MTPSMSRDGRYRLTLRIESRVDAEDLACGLAHAILHDLAGFDSETWTPESRRPGRERILRAARESMRGYGVEAAGYWRDDAEMLPEEYDADDLERWTRDVVDRAFPELRRR